MEAILRHRRAAVAGIMLASLLLFGCDFFDGFSESGGSRDVEKLREETRRELEEMNRQLEHEAEADQALASGEVLSVRVNYGNSGATQCQVRIDNERNGWYDEVEFIAHAGSLGGPGKMYDDYGFGATNFNRQLTQPEYYDPEDAAGEYRITVTAGTGYNATAKVSWDGERFSPSLLSFSLD